MPQYKIPSNIEIVRQAVRAIDFVVMMGWLHIFKMKTPWPSVLVEFGPGPTRLAQLKQSIFGEVIFIDRDDYGVTDRRLLAVDLDRQMAYDGLIGVLGARRANENILFFADHCLEHLMPRTAKAIVLEIARNPRWACCFRVPNILSPRGRRNFDSDATHKTDFGENMRRSLSALGISCAPWFRFYRGGPLLRCILRRSLVLSCEEIALIKRET